MESGCFIGAARSLPAGVSTSMARSASFGLIHVNVSLILYGLLRNGNSLQDFGFVGLVGSLLAPRLLLRYVSIWMFGPLLLYVSIHCHGLLHSAVSLCQYGLLRLKGSLI